MAYHPNGEAVVEALAANIEEDGSYFMPMADPTLPRAEQEAYMAKMEGKPWAIIKYRKAFSMDMSMNFVRGFLIDFIAVFLLCWILGKVNGLNMQTTVMISVAIGLIGYLSIAYLNTVWFEGSSIPDLIDAVVSWGAVGAWLGWYLNRGKRK